MRRRRNQPPRKICGLCGTAFYGWGSFCTRAECIAERTAPQEETLREYRKRVIDPERNAP